MREIDGSAVSLLDQMAEVMHVAHFRKTCLGGASLIEGRGCSETRMLAAALLEAGVLREEWTAKHAQGIYPAGFPSEARALEWIADNIRADSRRQRETRGKQKLLRRLTTRWHVEADHAALVARLDLGGDQ